ncbi:MAG: hypothetical protein HQ521_16815 [Bacteroidetes bacterium]|nr:hypothetical protein [Bacteroidota bacterium]
MKTNFIKVLPCIILLLLIGCSNPEGAFQEAMQENSIQALETFINDYPDSEFTLRASNIIDSLKFVDIKKRNSIIAYEKFIFNYPESEFRLEAKIIVDSLKYEKAKKANTINAYKIFILDCPESLKVDDAKSRISALKPVAGTWIGKHGGIEFSISSDQELIGVKNSKLKNNSSVILKLRTVRSLLIDIYIYDTINIMDDGSFSIRINNTSLGFVTLTGYFDSPSSASGEFKLTNYGIDKVNGSQYWAAIPKK